MPGHCSCPLVLGNNFLPPRQASRVYEGRNSSNTALPIFSTNTPAAMGLPTLMHKPQYPAQVAAQNAGYNRPPHPSFYLGYGMRSPTSYRKGYFQAREAQAPGQDEFSQ